MLLQMLTTRVCHASLRFSLTLGPACSAKVSPDLGSLLHHVDPGHIMHLPHATEQDSLTIASLISK
jgi:hypothetical protein